MYHPARRFSIRTNPFQLFLLVAAVFSAAATPSRVQFIVSGVVLALVGVAMAVTSLKKERPRPEVFLEEEHFDGGGTVRSKGTIWGGLSVNRGFRMLVLSPTSETLKFSLAYGFGRLYGPWTLQRAEVAKIERISTWWIGAHDAIRIITVSGPPWYFLSHEPGTVLACLEELGYPVSTDIVKWP